MKITDIYFHDGTTPVAAHEGPVFLIRTNWASPAEVQECDDWYVCPEHGLIAYRSYKGEGDVILGLWNSETEDFEPVFEATRQNGRLICLGLWPTRQAAQTYLDTCQPRP
ncbi:MAG: hypothetical protein ACK4Y5_20675 [Acetobacteraceae bacterium]